MNQSLEDQIQALAQANLIQKQALDRHKEQLEEQKRAIEYLQDQIDNIMEPNMRAKIYGI